MKIRLLSEQVAAKIAAGEVVERPVSVVKELIENSLDAASTQIIVEILNGGLDLVKVVDNGTGMESAELGLAFQRHATSKLGSDEDLDRVYTLGFRGEALPSIAAVSQIEVCTRERDVNEGWAMTLDWGRIMNQGPRGCPPGTSISISNLFQNVPARRKFLKSNMAEVGRIKEVICRYAMVNPRVGFQLSVDGRKVIQSSGGGESQEAIAVVFGVDVARTLMEVSPECSGGVYTLSGHISPPSLHRSNRRHIIFFVNGRWVRSRMLSIALEEAYHGLLPQGRYPLAVLDINVPYEDVDVNVHPAKQEVRFRSDRQVFVTVQRAVRNILIGTSSVPKIHLQTGLETSLVQAPLLPRQVKLPGRGDSQLVSGSESKGPAEMAPMLRVIGQFASTYIVAEGPDGIILLDQHAAHERVLYENVNRAMSEGDPALQSLLEPIMVDLSPVDIELIRDMKEDMERYGFILEPFGGNSYLLRAVPSIFRDSDPVKGLLEVTHMLARSGNVSPNRKQVIAASIACHSAVRAGMDLKEEEMVEMISLLASAKNPHTCPHGRPTMLHLLSRDLERQFGRR